MTAATPGQAAAEAYYAAHGAEHPRSGWKYYGDSEREAWEITARAGHAAIAAQEPKPAPELTALRELLDEIGVMAANAPEDGDSFGLLEEIAMRIAAAGVPDTTPIDEWPDPRGITLTDNKTDAPLADYCGQTLPLTDLDGDHVDCDPCHLACVLPRHHDDAGGWHYDEMDDVTWRKGRHVPAAKDAKPAPELAAAMAETRKVREQLAAVLDMFHGTGSGYSVRLSGVRLTREYAKAGLPVPERLRHLEGH